MQEPRIIEPDNGYFETWERACGHAARVSTEYTQMERRRMGRRSVLQAETRERLASTPCSRCAEQGAQA